MEGFDKRYREGNRLKHLHKTFPKVVTIDHVATKPIKGDCQSWPGEVLTNESILTQL